MSLTLLFCLTALVGWAARAKLWRKNTEPSKAIPLEPEWLSSVHRNHYSHRRIQKVPGNEKQNMVRVFDLISMKGSSRCVNKMRDYLGKRKMPEYLKYIAPEYIVDADAHRALATPWYKNGNILDFINKQAVGDGRKMALIMQTAQGLADLHSLGNLYPGNVLVTDVEDIVLTDAGIYTEVVKLMLLPSGRIPLPQSTVYKSPKEIREDEAPTKSNDV